MEYISDHTTLPVSLTLPKKSEPHCSKSLFPAFCGLLAEGSLAEMHCQVHGLDLEDYFGRLLATCYETIGAISITPYPLNGSGGGLQGDELHRSIAYSDFKKSSGNKEGI